MNGNIPVRLLKFWLTSTANSSKTLLELINTACGIHKLLLPSEEWVRICSNTSGDDVVVYSVDLLDFIRLSSGTGNVARASGHVLKRNGMILGMKIFFHD